LLLLFSVFSPETKQKISLTKMAEGIKQESVKELIVDGTEITIFYKDGRTEKALKEQGRGIIETLSDLGIKQEKLDKIEITIKEDSQVWRWIGSAAITLIPSIIILALFWNIIKGAKSSATAAFDFTQAKAKLFGAGDEKKGQRTTFDDVGGLKQEKEELREIVDFLKNPKKYFEIGAKIPHGVLLVGPPGTGKTLLARAVANEAGVPFFFISGSEFIELFVGVGASRVRNLFAQAKKTGRAIIFIDEIDSIGKARGAGLRGGGLEEREQTLNQILAEMDGFEKKSGIIVIGATNKPKALDPALLRPGRFDRRVELSLPDMEDRKKILEIHAKGKPLTPDVDLQEITERTPGFSGADLENLLNEAAILTARNNKKRIPQDFILQSIEKVLLGPERKNHLLSEKEKKIAAFHEAGHALVANSLGLEKVRKLSIIARGQSAGYTLKAPEREKRMKTESDFLNEIATLFGGLLAEEMNFGEISTGAANDLQRTTLIAKKMVTEYGMSSLGAISYNNIDVNSWEEMLFKGKDYSEKTAALIDKEVSKILEKGQKKAKRILKSKKRILEKLARALIRKETIEKEEFEKIVGKK